MKIRKKKLLVIASTFPRWRDDRKNNKVYKNNNLSFHRMSPSDHSWSLDDFLCISLIIDGGLFYGRDFSFYR
ncbi:hypothetical protein J4456_03070 [Candidatus Pacearchaeota archaeon]|nr:hypothetical protein [Candidatus Pacearchaeota archaeon]